MARSLTFVIDGPIDTQITITENADGTLTFDVMAINGGGQTLDYRALFFDIADGFEGLLDGLVVSSGGEITDQKTGDDSISTLGQDANINGDVVKDAGKFDIGVEVGTSGKAADDYDSYSFTLSYDPDGDGTPDQPLTLDMFAQVDFGVRATSVGYEGARNGSFKVGGKSTAAPLAVDDCVQTDEDTAASGFNILANDTDADGDILTVTAIEGGTIGTQFSATTAGGRNLLVTVNADGSVALDPAGNFEDLGTGDMDTLQLTYHVSDNNGGQDCAEVTFKITGVNDAPEANDDGPFFVEAGDMTTADVLGNDTDVDSAIDPASLTFSGATAGTAVNDSGALKYTANAIVLDFNDDSVGDDFTYTVADTEGAVSNAANVTVNVIDPLREEGSDSTSTSAGQPLSLAIATEDRTFNTSSVLEVDIASGSVDQTVNVSFVIDGSGSLNPFEYAEQLEAVQNSITQLRADYSGSAATVNVQLVQFSSVRTSTEVPTANAESYDLFDLALDDVATGTPFDPQLARFTFYEVGLDAAIDFFSTNGGAVSDNFMLFLSDGEPTDSASLWLDEVAELQGPLAVSISAVGFAGATQATLDLLDNTGGADIVANASEVGDAFADSPVFPAELINFRVEVNGVDQGLGVGDLTALGGGDFELDTLLLSLDNSNGATNTVDVFAEFDSDNDGVADEFLQATTVIDGTDGSGIIFG